MTFGYCTFHKIEGDCKDDWTNCNTCPYNNNTVEDIERFRQDEDINADEASD